MGVITDIICLPLKIIPGRSGEVMHVLKETEESFQGFGEAYFSIVHHQAVKGWKKHQKMILNLVVPMGAIRFVFFDDRPESKSYQTIQELNISKENYQRLTVPPGIWMAFQGLTDGVNMLLNIASIPHDPMEAENLPIQNDLIPFQGFT